MKELILQVLENHIQSERNKRCTCGWRPDHSDRRPQELFPEYRQHREHLAEAIAAATLQPAAALVETAENREGALYCHVTTYELRQALGMDTDNWPPPRCSR